MTEMGVEQIKVLSDPDRLAMKEMAATAMSNLLGLSVQNAQYHLK